MCSECFDEGYLGFLNPDGWIAGEIGDCWPFRLMIRRECPKCHGDPKSQLPPRPTFRFLYDGREPQNLCEQVLSKRVIVERPTSPPPPRPRTKHDEFNKLMVMCGVRPPDGGSL